MVDHFDDGGELGRFIKVWFSILTSLTYCYFISRNIPKGFPRLISVLPIMYILILLPLNLTSFHLIWGAGYCVSWLANFKLILFSFDAGPLSSNPPLVSSSPSSSMTLLQFLCIACLPVKIKQSKPSSQRSGTHVHGLKCYYALEGCLLGLVYSIYGYYERRHYKPNFIIIKVLYLLHTTFLVELMLIISYALARLVFDLDVESPFNNFFFLSTSFHEFWGRRWNSVASGILRSTVYQPVRHIFKRSWGKYVAILATFFVSGLMHELVFFYFGRKQPCWDVLGYFILHGLCLNLEIKVKESLNGKWQLYPFIAAQLVGGFFVCTCFGLLYPSLERSRIDIMASKDIANLTQLLKDILVHIKVLFLN